VKSMIPLDRIGNPDEVAQVVLLLASNASSYVPGQRLSPSPTYAATPFSRAMLG